MVKSCFAKQIFDWNKKLHTLCTDGAFIITGNASASVTLVKKIALCHFHTLTFMEKYLGHKDFCRMLERCFVNGYKCYQSMQILIFESTHLTFVLRSGSRITSTTQL